MNKVARFYMLALLGFLCGLFMSLHAQEKPEQNLLPLIGDPEERKYWRNDSGWETLQRVKQESAGGSWSALECHETSCHLEIREPQIKDDKLFIPLDDKDSLRFYFKVPNVRQSGKVKQLYTNLSADPFFSDENRMGDYTNPNIDKINSAPRKPFPTPLVFGSVKLTIESDSEYIRFVIESENKRQMLEQQKVEENTIFTVLWAGDLDGDGKPDILYEFMKDYGEGIRGTINLVLSSFAKDSKLVRQAASFGYYNGG